MVSDMPSRAEELEPLHADFGEQAALARNRCGQDDIKGADAIGRDDQNATRRRALPRNGVQVANLALTPVRQRQVSADQRLAEVP